MDKSQHAFEYERLADDLIRYIEIGAIPLGKRLPSVRQLARQRRVSISTVISAYYRLEAQGWIEARPRSGFFVRAELPRGLPEPDISSPESDPTQVSVRDLVTMVVLRDTLNLSLIQLGAAHPNPTLTATAKLNRIMASVGRRLGTRGGDYDLVPGCERLRVQVALRSVAAGCDLTPEDIVTTVGCTEAISVCLRAVCRSGDTVAIESPICFDALQCLEALGLRALEIPTHPRDGISLDALKFAVQHHAVRACLVISNFNNPIGSTIPEEHKQELVDFLARHDIPLIENDIFGEMYYGDRRPVVAKAYDRKGLVMLCSSFSKVLGPGYRVGWTAPGRFKAMVEWMKYTATLATPTLPQYAIAEFLAGGGYDRHLRRVRHTYAQYMAAMQQAVTRYFPAGTRYTRPAGGFLLWVQLPAQIDSLELYRRALRAGVAITPGYIFSASEQYRNFIRLNAANWSAHAERAVEKLGQLIREMG